MLTNMLRTFLMQRLLFSEAQPRTVHWQGCEFRFEPEFLKVQEANELLSMFSAPEGWRQDEIRMYGKSVPLPRLHRWFADERQTYRWSGLQMQAEKFPERLHSVRHRIAERVGVVFNTALANYYRDGRDSVAWHSDDEPELGSHPLISSLSLGATRRFIVRDKQDHHNKITFDLSHGSLLMMCGNVQRVSEHCVPKERTANPRINFTFRLMDKLQPVL
jgi:alkylated DNA repair dioxygenase AlkB